MVDVFRTDSTIIDSSVLEWGPLLGFCLVLGSAAVLRKRLTPVVAVAIVSLPGFLLQSLFMGLMLAKISSESAASHNLFFAIISFCLRIFTSVTLNYIYGFNWVPFIVFLLAVLVLRREYDPGWSARSASLALLAVLMVVASYCGTFNHLAVARDWLDMKGKV